MKKGLYDEYLRRLLEVNDESKTDDERAENVKLKMGTHGSAADYLAMLTEANRHIEALAAVRNDNDWDMSSAKEAREKIINAWINRAI